MLKKPYKKNWTIDEITSGIRRFQLNHGHFPDSYEIDLCDYLPTSRSIQRSHGGLQSVRRMLGLNDDEIHHGKGAKRSIVAKEAGERSWKVEELFYNRLCTLFQDLHIHEQKPLRPSHVRADFFVYLYPAKPSLAEKGIAIDLFYPKDLFNMAGCVRVKLKKYQSLGFNTYLIVCNEAIDEDDVGSVISSLSNPFPKNIHLITQAGFWHYLPHLAKEE